MNRDAPVHLEALSLKETAIVLGVHEDTVRRWIATGYLIACRVGPKLIRVSRAEIARLRTVRVLPHIPV